MNPGIYIVKDGPLEARGHSSIEGDEVGFFVYGSDANADFKGDTVLQLTAPTSGPMAGMILAQDRNSSQGKTNVFSGNSQLSVSGTIYTPTQVINFWGSNSSASTGSNVQIIAVVVEIGGNALLRVDTGATSEGFAANVRSGGTVQLVE